MKLGLALSQPRLDILRLDRALIEVEHRLDVELVQVQGIDAEEPTVGLGQGGLMLLNFSFCRFPPGEELPCRLVLGSLHVVGDSSQGGEQMLFTIFPVVLGRVHLGQERVRVGLACEPGRVLGQVLEVLERGVAQGFQEQGSACTSLGFGRAHPDLCPDQVVFKRAVRPVPCWWRASIGP